MSVFENLFAKEDLVLQGSGCRIKMPTATTTKKTSHHHIINIDDYLKCLNCVVKIKICKQLSLAFKMVFTHVQNVITPPILLDYRQSSQIYFFIVNASLCGFLCSEVVKFEMFYQRCFSICHHLFFFLHTATAILISQGFCCGCCCCVCLFFQMYIFFVRLITNKNL